MRGTLNDLVYFFSIISQDVFFVAGMKGMDLKDSDHAWN